MRGDDGLLLLRPVEPHVLRASVERAELRGGDGGDEPLVVGNVVLSPHVPDAKGLRQRAHGSVEDAGRGDQIICVKSCTDGTLSLQQPWSGCTCQAGLRCRLACDAVRSTLHALKYRAPFPQICLPF